MPFLVFSKLKQLNLAHFFKISEGEVSTMLFFQRCQSLNKPKYIPKLAKFMKT